MAGRQLVLLQLQTLLHGGGGRGRMQLLPNIFCEETAMRCKLGLLLLLLAMAAVALADEHKSAIAPNAAFDKMKSLDGSWTGVMVDAGKEYPATTRYMMVSDGSALMGWLAEGTPYEMVTIFHMDGKQLMATHYCASHNQPRFVAETGGDPNRVVFKFKDGTNIGEHDGHMQEVVFTFDGSDHHTEDWTYIDPQGKTSVGHFDFKRKK